MKSRYVAGVVALISVILMATKVLAAGDPRMEKAAAKGDAASVKQLLSQGVDANARYDIRRTALMVAANGGHESAAAALLDAGADPNLQDNNTQTALMLAAINAHLPVVKLLINRGADPYIVTNDGTVIKYINYLAYSTDMHIIQRRDPRIIPVAQYLESNEVKRVAAAVGAGRAGASASVVTSANKATGQQGLVGGITVDFSAYRPSDDQVRAAGIKALVGRGWKVESVSTKTYLQGSLSRRGETYKVGIRLVWPKAEIGYLAGFSQPSDNWLRNLEQDMIAEMEIVRLGGR